MNNFPKLYTFDDFRFDADRLAFYYKNALVKAGDKKTMQVLAVLLLHPNSLTAHEEIIETVWQDNRHGVDSSNVAQYISKLRRLFAEYAPDKNYIETVKSRGYIFVGEVLCGESESRINLQTAPTEDSPFSPEIENYLIEKPVDSFRLSKSALFLLLLIPIFVTAFFARTWFFSGEQEIRQVVKDSQLYESLMLYKNPAAFDESSMNKYWTADTDLDPNSDRRRISETVKKMTVEKRHYGDETKCEQFEFQTVEINQDKNFAVVKTLEKWFVSVYSNDGTLLRNKTVGPYFVSYILRKVDGRWLIEKSTTARMTRPTPRLSDIETTSAVKAGQQFFVKITGQDFEAATVSVEIIGTGCPENKPCKVANSLLLDKSKLTEIALENVPLTLPTGIFRVTVRNGDSPPSNFVTLQVP